MSLPPPLVYVLVLLPEPFLLLTVVSCSPYTMAQWLSSQGSSPTPSVPNSLYPHLSHPSFPLFLDPSPLPGSSLRARLLSFHVLRPLVHSLCMCFYAGNKGVVTLFQNMHKPSFSQIYSLSSPSRVEKCAPDPSTA